MRLGKQARELMAPIDNWQKLEYVIAFALFVTGAFAVSIFPFTRKDFGERFLGWLNLYVGYSLMGVFLFFGNVIWAASSHSSFDLINVFWLAFIGLSLYHRSEINRKNKKGELWHSMYIGTPIVRLPWSPEKTFKLVEPASIGVVGLVLWQFSPGVGLWLMISSASVFLFNNIFFYQQRQRLLNARDAWIESQYMHDALQGKAPKETKGLVIAESNLKMINSNVHLKDAFDKMSLEMKDMIDDDPFDIAA